MKKRELPKSVFLKSGTYYLVRADGDKRKWIKLSRAADGLPGLYAALAEAVTTTAIRKDLLPAVIAQWERRVMPKHAESTQRDEKAMCKRIAEAFPDFVAGDIDPPDVATFLDQFQDKPRTFNAYRGMIRELMRFAEERGYRPAGSNPVQALRTMATPARERYITDSELRRIKVAALRWSDKDGSTVNADGSARLTRSGPMLCALIDMAVMTGQRIGDLLALEWDAVGDEGISFRQSKTGARVLVQWSPKLRDVVERLKVMRKARRGFTPRVFTTQDGKAYTYWGASTAWRRALDRAGMKDTHFHDLRAKAGTEKEAREGMQGARVLLGHSTEQQTSAYVRNRTARKTGASR